MKRVAGLFRGDDDDDDGGGDKFHGKSHLVRKRRRRRHRQRQRRDLSSFLSSLRRHKLTATATIARAARITAEQQIRSAAGLKNYVKRLAGMHKMSIASLAKQLRLTSADSTTTSNDETAANQLAAQRTMTSSASDDCDHQQQQQIIQRANATLPIKSERLENLQETREALDSKQNEDLTREESATWPRRVASTTTTTTTTSHQGNATLNELKPTAEVNQRSHKFNSTLETTGQQLDDQDKSASEKSAVHLIDQSLPLESNKTITTLSSHNDDDDDGDGDVDIEHQQDFDDELEDQQADGPTSTKGIRDRDEEAAENVLGADTSTSASVSDQLVDFDSPDDDKGGAGGAKSNVDRRVSLISSFTGGGGGAGQPAAAAAAAGAGASSGPAQNLLAVLGSPLTSELRKLRQSGMKKVQQALRHNKRRRRRRKRRRPNVVAGQADEVRLISGHEAALVAHTNHNKKRETTSLPLALIKSMQTRQGLGMSSSSSSSNNVGGAGGVGQAAGQHFIGQHFYSNGATPTMAAATNPLIKQLVAVNPLKQQLASSSMQISTAIQRLLANKFLGGSSTAASHGAQLNGTRTGAASNKLMLHNNSNQLSALGAGLDESAAAAAAAMDQVGGDFSATSAATSSSGSSAAAQDHFGNLLASSQQHESQAPLHHHHHQVGSTTASGGGGGHTNEPQSHVDFLTDFQHHHQLAQQRPQTPQQFGAGDDEGGGPLQAHHHGDYQGSASSTADRLAELMGHWNQAAAGAESPSASSAAGMAAAAGQAEAADQALKLSQLVVAATAAAAAASGQSTPSAASAAAAAASNKQLIPIEMIGLDPSVTNSILYGSISDHQQQSLRPLIRQQQQQQTGANQQYETPGGGGGGGGSSAASELDVQENPHGHYQPSLRHRPAVAATDQAAYASGQQPDGDSPADSNQAEQQQQQQQQPGQADQAQEAADKSRQKPSSVLHIHHFHHTQPAASGIVEHQAIPTGPGASSPSDGEQLSEQPEVGADQQATKASATKVDETDESGVVVSGAQRFRGAKLMRTSEAPKVILVSGESSGEAVPSSNLEQQQQQQQGEETSGQAGDEQQQAWPGGESAGEGQSQNNVDQTSNSEEVEGENETHALASKAPKKMRFVTRQSLRSKQQQQPNSGGEQQIVRVINSRLVPMSRHNPNNLTYVQSYPTAAQDGYNDPTSRFSSGPQLMLSNQRLQLEQPAAMLRPSQQLFQRRPDGSLVPSYNQTYSRHLTAPFTDLLHVPQHQQQQQLQPELQQELSPDGRGQMLMVAYRPAATIVPTSGGQALEAQYDQHIVNRTYAAGGLHNAYTRQTPPYNEVSESKPQNQLQALQRLHPNGTLALQRPPSQHHHHQQQHQQQQLNRGPSTNLLKTLMKQPKMNQMLLLQQLQTNNQTNSPYWNNEDERLLAQFNMVNTMGFAQPSNQLRLTQANLDPLSNGTTTSQLVDNLALLRQLNQTVVGANQAQQLQVQPLSPSMIDSLNGNTSQRLTNDELALMMQEQAIRQLQQQNLLKQQQQQQVASLLLNNLSSNNNPLVLSKIIGNISGNNNTHVDNNMTAQKANGRFEMTMASDRATTKNYPMSASRNVSSATSPLASHNGRINKNFHVPNTRMHDKADAPMDQVIAPFGATSQPAAKLPSSQMDQAQILTPPSPPQVHVASTTTKQQQQHQVEVDNLLDSAHGLGNLALAFIFLVSLMSFVLILVSFIYRRRRAVGSARCGPSTLSGEGPSRSGNSGGAAGNGNGIERGGQKSLRCLNNLTQRTKHLMRSNFTSGNSTSNVIAGSTPSSSLKSLNQLDSSITSNVHGSDKLQNHHHQHQQQQAHDNRALIGEAGKQLSSPAVAVSKKSAGSHLFESNKMNGRHGWAAAANESGTRNNVDRTGTNYTPSTKYNCANSASTSSNLNAKMSTFNVQSASHLLANHHHQPEKYSTPDDNLRSVAQQLGGGQHHHHQHHSSGSDIRTLNTRLQKAAYLQKALGSTAQASPPQERLAPSSKSSVPAHQPSKLSSKKQQQYNRSSPASIEMVNGQAKYVNTQTQLKHANL